MTAYDTRLFSRPSGGEPAPSQGTDPATQRRKTQPGCALKPVRPPPGGTSIMKEINNCSIKRLNSSKPGCFITKASDFHKSGFRVVQRSAPGHKETNQSLSHGSDRATWGTAAFRHNLKEKKKLSQSGNLFLINNISITDVATKNDYRDALVVQVKKMDRGRSLRTLLFGPNPTE